MKKRFLIIVLALLAMGMSSPAWSQEIAKPFGEWEGVSAKDGTVLRITLLPNGKFSFYVVEKEGPDGKATPHSGSGTFALDTSVMPWKLTLTPSDMPVKSTILAMLSKKQMLMQKFDDPTPEDFTVDAIVLTKAPSSPF